MAPVTALAAVTNQEATWDDRPSVLTDDDWFSNTIYETSKILTPTLIFRRFGLGAGLGVQGQRALESGIETASIDSMDDLTGGRSTLKIMVRCGELLLVMRLLVFNLPLISLKVTKNEFNLFLRLMHSSKPTLSTHWVKALYEYLVTWVSVYFETSLTPTEA